jgi:hypothetical protein
MMNYIWAYMVPRIYTNDSERIVAVADYRWSWSHGSPTNKIRINLLDRRHSEWAVGGLRQSYDSPSH